MRAMLTGLPLAGLLAAACGGGGDDGNGGGDVLPSEPGEAMLQLFEFVRNGQWVREWEHLHAAHQDIAPRAEFLRCNQSTAVSFESSRVIEVFDEMIDVPSIGEVETTAVTVELLTDIGGSEQSRRFTLHLIDVSGAWRWILNDDALAACEAGGCP